MSKTFEVYQIQMTKEMVNRANLVGREEAMQDFPEYAALMKYSHPMLEENPDFVSDDWEHYTHVADIRAENLDGVFEVGNIGPADKITRCIRMRSISVGDVIEDIETGRFYMVAAFGFTDITAGVMASYADM